VVKFDKQPGFFESLLGGETKSRVPGPSAGGGGGGTTVNGVNVNVGPELLDELNRPRLMYLWRGQ